MKRLKNLLLTNIVKQVLKTAQLAAGTSSHWGMYQPKEPKTKF